MSFESHLVRLVPLTALLLLLAGCSDAGRKPGARATFPKLDEAPPPAMPRLTARMAAETAATEVAPRREVVASDSWLTRQEQNASQVKAAREYAARMGTNDPFAMSEVELAELAEFLKDGTVEAY